MKVEGRYVKVLQVLAAGPKASEEILRECGFADTFHCSSALSILVRQGFIAKGYRLTEAGRRAIGGADGEMLPDTSTTAVGGPTPPIPRPVSPGFEWTFDEKRREWVQKRKPGFEVVRPLREQQEFDLFG